MLERKKIKDLNDYFLKLEERKEKGVYFYRICGYSEKVGEFIKKYYDTARRTGVPLYLLVRKQQRRFPSHD